MKKTLVSLLLGLMLLVVGGYYLYTTGQLKNISDASLNFVEKNISEKVFAPGPLRKDNDDTNPSLSIKGVIEETNRHRAEAGLTPLTESTKLNIAAQKKVDDMFTRQYFEHDAPTGEGVKEVVEGVGYELIVVGENLALGNYKDDATLVQAWMDSPGHRENILKESYTEIGVAVARGEYEGKTTWLAVQHFAKPLSDCPSVDLNMKMQLETNKGELDRQRLEIEQIRAEMEIAQTETREQREEYNRKVDEYNSLVDAYNTLLTQTKELESVYNAQVQAFNECARQA